MSNTETILVVDDNHQISDFLVGSVLPSLGYQSMVAYDGRSAIEIIRKHHRYIDLLLLDMQLPDFSGLNILRLLEKDKLSLPTILFTAHGSEQVAVEAFRLGVVDYLNKPVEVDVLSAALIRALTTARLRQDKERLTNQLQEQVNWLTALNAVSQSLISTLDVNEVLKRIVEAGVQLTKAEEGFLALLDQTSGQLFLRVVKNLDEKTIKTIHLPVTDSIIGGVLRSKHPLRATQKKDQPLKVSTGYLVYSLLHIPLYSKDIPLGVLSVDNRSKRKNFSATDEAILTSLADYATIALVNAQLYSQAQQEIKLRIQTEKKLRESEERYALAVRGANDGLWDWDLRQQQIFLSPRWKAMLGYEDEELKNMPDEWFSRIHSDDRSNVMKDIEAHLKGSTRQFQSEYRIRHKDGLHRWVLSRGIAIHDANQVALRIAGSMTDINDRKQVEQKLLYDALHDELTGLYNRAMLLERIRLSLERMRRHPEHQFAVLFLDLDRFKDVNDTMGHSMGDRLLFGVARLLEKIVRPTDMVARLGGDEFVVLLDGIHNNDDAILVADRIQNELKAVTPFQNHKFYITTSIGIVFGSVGEQNPLDILRDADIAMYRAKVRGKARYEIFDPSMRDSVMQRMVLETELRQALEKHEFTVYYQPILSIKDHRVIGFEALLRWQNPQQGLLVPKSFLYVAEETGLVVQIDRWILRQACFQMREWQKQFPNTSELKININLSAKQMLQPDLIEYIDKVLQESQIEASRLNLEITESVVMENFPRTVEVLQELQKRGIQIQVDDFGVGYSSLGYLSRFPLDALKIDQSFISSMERDEANLRIIQAIVMMTQGLGINVIAEGVETKAQLSRLRELGCEIMQGYLIARPLSSEQTELLLSQITQDSEHSSLWDFNNS